MLTEALEVRSQTSSVQRSDDYRSTYYKYHYSEIERAALWQSRRSSECRGRRPAHPPSGTGRLSPALGTSACLRLVCDYRSPAAFSRAPPRGQRSPSDAEDGQEGVPQPPGGLRRQPRRQRADRPRDHRHAQQQAPLELQPLEEDFFNEIIRCPIPIDMNTLRAMKRSPLGLDLYLWLTYRTFALKRPLRLTWRQLYRQF